MLFQNIKKQRLQAMKDKDTIKANLLGTLLSEAAKEDKEPSDEQVLRTVKKFIESTDETIKTLGNRGQNADNQYHEKQILESFLPKQMSETEIDQAVHNAILETGAQTNKDMGLVMAELKKHGAAIDMKTASQKAKEKLS